MSKSDTLEVKTVYSREYRGHQIRVDRELRQERGRWGDLVARVVWVAYIDGSPEFVGAVKRYAISHCETEIWTREHQEAK